LIAAFAGAARPRVGLPYGLVLGAAWITDVANRAVGRESTLLVLDEVRLARLPMFFTSAKTEAEADYSYRSAADAVADAVAWFKQCATTDRLTDAESAA
jgi:dihydroflavonol-4-reductase